MTQMPLVAAIALIVTAVLFVVGIITLIVGFATHRVSMESPLADDDDNDDLSDDTATLLSMLPGASVVVDEHDEVVRCNPAAYRLGVVSDDAIAQQHVLDAIHEARKSGGKRQFDLTTDTPERYVADQNKGDHVATQSVHRPNWLKVTVGRINEQFVIVLITDVSDVIRLLPMCPSNCWAPLRLWPNSPIRWSPAIWTNSRWLPTLAGCVPAAASSTTWCLICCCSYARRSRLRRLPPTD